MLQTDYFHTLPLLCPTGPANTSNVQKGGYLEETHVASSSCILQFLPVIAYVYNPVYTPSACKDLFAKWQQMANNACSHTVNGCRICKYVV